MAVREYGLHPHRVIVPKDVGGGFITLKVEPKTEALALKRQVIEKIGAKRLLH